MHIPLFHTLARAIYVVSLAKDHYNRYGITLVSLSDRLFKIQCQIYFSMEKGLFERFILCNLLLGDDKHVSAGGLWIITVITFLTLLLDPGFYVSFCSL